MTSAIMRRALCFKREASGIAAVEFAIIGPVLCVALLGGLDVFQAMSQRNAVNFAATSAASIGGRSLNGKEGAIGRAVSGAQLAYDAARTSGVFILNARPTLGTIQALDSGGSPTSDDAKAVALEVTVSASSDAVFPILSIKVFHASATVRS